MLTLLYSVVYLGYVNNKNKMSINKEKQVKTENY